MLKIGDKPLLSQVFSLNKYGVSGSITFNDAFFDGKITIFSFVDINGGWDWVYHLLKLRKELDDLVIMDVQIVIVFFEYNASITASIIDNKFPTGSGTEQRFSKSDLTTTADLYTVIDTDHSKALNYLTAFDQANDSSYSGGCDGTKMWTFIVSGKGTVPNRGFICDKWETCFTAKSYPISFNRLSNYIARLTLTGTIAQGTPARLGLNKLGTGFTGKYIDISFDGTKYSYAHSTDLESGVVVKAYPANGDGSSVLEPIYIQFAASQATAGSSSSYTLTKQNGDPITGITLNTPSFQTSFMSDGANFGAAARYLKNRIDNLLAAPRVLAVSPAQGNISGLPNSQIDIVLSKPLGALIESPPDEKYLDTSAVTDTANYALAQAAGLTLDRALYENSGLRSIVENVGKIENVLSLKFTGKLQEGVFTIDVNTSPHNIKDTNGAALPEVNYCYTVALGTSAQYIRCRNRAAFNMWFKVKNDNNKKTDDTEAYETGKERTIDLSTYADKFKPGDRMRPKVDASWGTYKHGIPIRYQPNGLVAVYDVTGTTLHITVGLIEVIPR